MLGNIYIIKNKINNKVYIGQTIKDINIRFYNHKIASKYEDTKFYRALKKYGIENFYIELIEQVPIEELNKREQYWINQYDSYKNGYNSTLGGDGVRLKDYNAIILNWNKGLNLTQIEKKLKIGRDSISKILQTEYGISKEQINERGNSTKHSLSDSFIITQWNNGLTPYQIVKKYGSTVNTIKKVLNKYGISNDIIKQRIDEKQRNYSNQQVKELWNQGLTIKKIQEITKSNFDTIKKQLLKEGITQFEINKRKSQNCCQMKKQVLQYDLDNNFIKEYESAAEAGRQNNIPSYGIRECANYKKTDYKNYIWRWK